jgi:4-hydroxybenzoate polyprenyltransferase/geranylgeranylglycerol-phosphate geranylgeranyltransferase
MYGGDYFDRELDAIAKPHRPIPSGRISARTAFVCFVASVALGGVVAVVLNPLNALVVVATLGLGVSYSRYLKARGAWGNVVRGGVTAMAFVMGTLATSPAPSVGLLLFALVFWLHDSGSNVVGTICDREGDRAGGYRTVPVRHGDTAALWLMAAFDLAWFAVAAAAPLSLGEAFDRVTYWPFLTVAAAMGVGSAAMLVRAPRPIPRVDAVRAHQVLVIERLVLVCGLIAATTSVAFGLTLLGLSVLVTVLTSRVLSRDVATLATVRRERT